MVSTGRRAVAGAVDAAAVVIVALVLVTIPWRLGGFTLPMLGALSAILAISVAPLVALGATLGLWLTGLRMTGLDGRRPDAVEVAFRELLGRGLLPASYLVVAGAGVLSVATGRGGFHTAGRLGLVLVATSAIAASIAAAGHLLALVRDDRRSLADLLGRTRVVPREAVPMSSEPDLRGEQLAADGRAAKILWAFEVGLVAAALGGQILLGRPVPANASQLYADRKFRERAEMLFEASPGDADLARNLLERLEREGDQASAQRARAKHAAAFAAVERVRELTLRESVARNPRDEGSVRSLVSLLEQQSRFDEARQVLQTYVELVPSVRGRVEFGAWLQQRRFAAEAVQQLRSAIDQGEVSTEVYAYLGFALHDLKRDDEARAAFSTALTANPDWDEVRAALESLGPDTRKAPDAGLH